MWLILRSNQRELMPFGTITLKLFSVLIKKELLKNG